MGGDVTTENAVKHMKGDVCQMQIVESVWSIHDFIVAKNRACAKGRLAELKADAARCFDGNDKATILKHATNMEAHLTKSEDGDFDADLDLIIKDVLAMSVATHESEHVAKETTVSAVSAALMCATAS